MLSGVPLASLAFETPWRKFKKISPLAPDTRLSPAEHTRSPHSTIFILHLTAGIAGWSRPVRSRAGGLNASGSGSGGVDAWCSGGVAGTPPSGLD